MRAILSSHWFAGYDGEGYIGRNQFRPNIACGKVFPRI